MRNLAATGLVGLRDRPRRLRRRRARRRVRDRGHLPGRGDEGASSRPSSGWPRPTTCGSPSRTSATETVPDLTATVFIDEGADGAFSTRIDQPGVGQPEPAGLDPREQVAAAQGRPRSQGALGRRHARRRTPTRSASLEPDETKEMIWRVTPVIKGRWTVNYQIQAGTQGKAPAVTEEGDSVAGDFAVQDHQRATGRRASPMTARSSSRIVPAPTGSSRWRWRLARLRREFSPWRSLSAAHPPMRRLPSPATARAASSSSRSATSARRCTSRTRPGEGKLLFVVEQGGTIRVVKTRPDDRAPVPRHQDIVQTGGEQGLLSIAFARRLPEEPPLLRLLHEHRSARSRSISSSAAVVAAAGQPSDRAASVITIPHPAANHNGGQLQMAGKGNLFLGTGDGGGAGDQFDNARKTIEPARQAAARSGRRRAAATRSRRTIRSPAAADGRDEIFSIGLRNPWRFAFDRANPSES